MSKKLKLKVGDVIVDHENTLLRLLPETRAGFKTWTLIGHRVDNGKEWTSYQVENDTLYFKRFATKLDFLFYE